MKSIVQTLLVVAALAVVGCGVSKPQNAGGTVNPQGLTACEQVRGLTFESVRELPMGRNSVVGKWTIAFAANGSEATFAEQDFSVTTSYTCDSDEGRVTAEQSGRRWEGNYNAEHKLLVVDGIWYQVRAAAAQ